ncbi:MAG: hypothetical protein M1816_000332 [Peltula sp. TS41687]|nr:MAG: hypothetical protein M1816_000332 [Peltula sp. TS41687]
MGATLGKKRRAINDDAGDSAGHKKRRKSKRQQAYDSSSSSDEEKVHKESDSKDVEDHESQSQKPKHADSQPPKRNSPVAESEGRHSEEIRSTSDDQSDSDSAASSNAPSATQGKKRKRNDPDAFANSISKILSSKLTTTKRADPVLARSKVAIAAGQEISEAKLEAKARHKLREEKKAQLDRGRVKDVLGVEGHNGEGTAAEVGELERRLKKTAQRGVIKLFNAVRAAQVKGEQAAREARMAGVVGVKGTESKVNEMSKQGFLELIAAAGSKDKRAVSTEG